MFNWLKNTIQKELRKIMEDTVNPVVQGIIDQFSGLFDQFDAALTKQTETLANEVGELRTIHASILKLTENGVQLKSADVERINGLMKRFGDRIKSIDTITTGISSLSDSLGDSVEEVVTQPTPAPEPTPTPAPVPEPVQNAGGDPGTAAPVPDGTTTGGPAQATDPGTTPVPDPQAAQPATDEPAPAPPVNPGEPAE